LLNAIWTIPEPIGFGVDMVLTNTTGVNPRVPVVLDGFLFGWNAKAACPKSYVVWEENEVVPILTLELVS